MILSEDNELDKTQDTTIVEAFQSANSIIASGNGYNLFLDSSITITTSVCPHTDFVTVETLDGRLKRLESKLTGRIERTEIKVAETEKKVVDLAHEAKEDKISNIYSFADQSERSDYASNLLKANSVLITGTIFHSFHLKQNRLNL